jgi:hypothetical protein
MTIIQRWKQTALHNKALVLSGVIVALGTVVSTAAVVSQVVIAKRNNRNTSAQVQKLIDAANIQAGGASSFASSAREMNSGIIAAVDKLNLQAAATTQLSKEAEIANTNSVEADRPWMGASFSVTTFDVGKNPTFYISFANSGKRPAKVRLTASRENMYAAFPTNPDQQYIFDTVPSVSVVVPGQNVVSISRVSDPMTQIQMDVLASGQLTYFIFGKIEYTDIRTDKAYWTHACWRYMPKMKTDNDNGFRDCSEYNDAK